VHPYLLLPMAASALCAACAGGIFMQSPGQGTSRRAALLVLGAAFWALCEVVWNLAPDAETALFWIRLSGPGWMFVGPLVLHVFLDTSPLARPRLRRALPLLYAGSAVFLALLWTTPWLMEGAVRTSWGWGYEVGPAYPVFYAITMLGVLPGAWLAFDTFRGILSQAEQRQRPFVVLGVGIPVVVASLTDVLLPIAGVQVPRLGTTSFAIMSAIAASNLLWYGYSFLSPGSFAEEILAALDDGVALLYRSGRIRRGNAALARISGHPAKRLEGMPATELLAELPVAPREPDPRPALETELCTADGSWLPVSVATGVLRDRRGHSLGLVVVVRDLREVSTLRRRLVTSARLAAVGELAAGIAHEINNPIAFVRANLGQLRDHWKTLRGELESAGRERALREVLGEGEELLEESLEGVDRAADIVRGVKGFSHAGGGDRESADWNRLVDAALHMAATQIGGRAVVERCTDDVPPVPCNPQEIKQVFLNLLLNAAQAVEPGGRIRIRTRRGDGCVLAVFEDDGCGIPAKNLERIFDPFFTTKKVGEGTGLGLGIAWQIVKSHGGEIAVDSTPGEGSRFTVKLPV